MNLLLYYMCSTLSTHHDGNGRVKQYRVSIPRCALVHHLFALGDQFTVTLLVSAVAADVEQLDFRRVVASPTE